METMETSRTHRGRALARSRLAKELRNDQKWQQLFQKAGCIADRPASCTQYTNIRLGSKSVSDASGNWRPPHLPP